MATPTRAPAKGHTVQVEAGWKLYCYIRECRFAVGGKENRTLYGGTAARDATVLSFVLGLPAFFGDAVFFLDAVDFLWQSSRRRAIFAERRCKKTVVVTCTTCRRR